MTGRLRIVCVGWGAIMRRAAALIAERVPAASIVAVAVRDDSSPRAAWPAEARHLASPEELVPGFADLVIEAAKADAVEPWGAAALRHAKIFSPLTISAFAVDGRLQRLQAIAEQNGSRIVIPSGAIGGMDALRSASFAGLDTVVHEIIKPVAAWEGTEAEKLMNFKQLTGSKTFLVTTAREASSRFPQNANVAGLVALCGIGFDRTIVKLTADPAATRNSHIISAEGVFGRFSIRLDNNPLADNPKSSEMTALSLVRLVESQCASVVW